jgi:hypothetical protein
MNDTIISTDAVVDLGAIQRIIVQPALLAGDPDAGGADGMDALVQMFRAEVERALRRRLAACAPEVEVDWSKGIGAAGPRGIAAATHL